RRQRQQFTISPHIRCARGKQFARNARAKRIVIVGNFERRETVFADAAGLVAPGLAAFAAAELVRARLHFATSFCDCGTSRVKITPVNTKPLFRMGKEAREMRIVFAYPNLMVPVTGRELAPAIEID